MLSSITLTLRFGLLLLAIWLIWSHLFPRARQEVDRAVRIAAWVLMAAAAVALALHFFR